MRRQLETPHRPSGRLRSDAAANRERLLTAAAAAVRRDGERVPLARIAEQAGVGIGTLYRHYPDRPQLLAALALHSFALVVGHARTAASIEPATAAVASFFEQTIAARDELILPLHGGPVVVDERTTALRAEIREVLGDILSRGAREGTLRGDVTAQDIIIFGAMLAQPLPNVVDWDGVARRQAAVFIAGLAPGAAEDHVLGR